MEAGEELARAALPSPQREGGLSLGHPGPRPGLDPDTSASRPASWPRFCRWGCQLRGVSGAVTSEVGLAGGLSCERLH